MADNTVLNSGTGGDTIRTLAKTATSPAKTQVMALDVGGGDAAPESLLTLGQATKAASIPVALASDQGALPVTIASADSTNIASTATATAAIETSSAAVASAAGTPADAAWAGTGNSTIIAALKAIWSAIKGTLNIRALSSGTDSVAVTGSVVPSSTGKSIELSVTRPATITAYSAGAVQGPATGSSVMTFSALGAASGTFMITDVTLRRLIAALPTGMAGFRLHLYNVSPPSAYADGAVWDLPSTDTGYQGYIDLPTPTDMGSTLFAQIDQSNKVVSLDGSGNLYAYLVTTAGYTPTASSVHDVRLSGVPV